MIIENKCLKLVGLTCSLEMTLHLHVIQSFEFELALATYAAAYHGVFEILLLCMVVVMVTVAPCLEEVKLGFACHQHKKINTTCLQNQVPSEEIIRLSLT